MRSREEVRSKLTGAENDQTDNGRATRSADYTWYWTVADWEHMLRHSAWLSHSRIGGKSHQSGACSTAENIQEDCSQNRMDNILRPAETSTKLESERVRGRQTSLRATFQYILSMAFVEHGATKGNASTSALRTQWGFWHAMTKWLWLLRTWTTEIQKAMELLRWLRWWCSCCLAWYTVSNSKSATKPVSICKCSRKKELVVCITSFV